LSASLKKPLTAAGLALILALFLAQAAYYWYYVNDDAFITFRYSRFLAMGRGPYFNMGEHVEGYTNFLLMLLMAPVIALGGEGAALPAAKLIGVLCAALSLGAAFALCRMLCRQSEGTSAWAGLCGLAATGMAAVCPAYALNSTSGLETALFSACITSGLFLGLLSYGSGRWRGAGLAFAAAALTRPEGIAIFSIFWVAQLFTILTRAPGSPGDPDARRPLGTFKGIRVPRHLIMDAVIVGAVFAGHLAFRLIAYDGEWLPNTYYAKIGGFWKTDPWTYIKSGILTPFFGLAGIIPALIGLSLDKQIRKVVLPAFFVVLAGSLLPLYSGTDWMPGWRFVIPYIPLTAALVVTGWSQLGRMLSKRGWAGPLFSLLCIPMLIAAQSDMRRGLYKYTFNRTHGYGTGHTALAEWLRREAAGPGDTIALMDIGIVGYLCIEQSILDITGLTDRFIAKSPGGFLSKQVDPSYILERGPEFIVLTFTCPGDPLKPPSEGLEFIAGTDIEDKLYRHPVFRELYMNKRAPRGPDAGWMGALAAELGAERIFQHTHPGGYYLLAPFRRSESH